MHLLRQCKRAFESISSEWSFCAGAAVGVIWAPAALLLCMILPRSRALWLGAGTLLLLFFRALPGMTGPDTFAEILEGRSASVNYELRLTDLRLNEVPGLEQKKGVLAQLVRFTDVDSGEKYHCRGEVTVYANYPLPRRYGAVVTGRGELLSPDPDKFFSKWVLLTDTWKLKGYEKSWRSHVLEIRNKLLGHLVSSITNDTSRQLAAAFFLGNTGGMTPERRRDFAAAGTIHLFAVSGLHVGLAALLILWILRFLPFRSRCFAAAAGVWCYVLLTGAAVPALRAGFMIGLFLVCRGMLLSTPPLRLMGAAAGMIIIADPDSLSSIGFHYSFLITAVLLLLSERLQEERQLEGRLFTIMPRTAENLFQYRLFNWGFSLRALVISGVAAALAGSIVSLYHNMALTPGAVLANCFTMPVLGVLFAMLPVKLLASLCSPAADRMAAAVIEMLFHYLRSVAAYAAELAAPVYAFAPGIFWSVLLAGTFLGALGLKNRKWAAVSGVIFLLLFCSFPFRTWCEKARVTVISSDSAVPPTVVISEPFLDQIILVNPARGHTQELEKAIRRSGMTRISEVRFSRPSVRNASALHYLALRYDIEKVVMPPLTGRNWQFSDLITERKGDFFYVQEGKGGEKLRLFREKNKFAIEYPDSGAMLGWRLDISDRDKGRAVRFVRRGKESTVTLPWSNKNGVWHHEL